MSALDDPLRRRLLLIGAGLAASAAGPDPARARTSLEAAVMAFTGGLEARPGGLRLDVPPLVENGNAVGLAVAADSAMTVEDHVRRIGLFNEKNPQPDVAIFHLSPAGGVARVSTRIRLSTTQRVVAVAEMSDGSFRRAEAEVTVALAACIEDLL